MDDLLQALGFKDLKYDELKPDERATFHDMLKHVKQSQLTIEDIRGYIHQLRDRVEQELADTPETITVWLFFQVPNRKSIVLKARLMNYLLLESFLLSPVRAEKALKKALDNVK